MNEAARNSFIQLIRSTIREFGGDWQSSFKDVAELRVGQAIAVEFRMADAVLTMMHDVDELNADRFLIQSTLGIPPEEIADAVLQRLLELNHEISPLNAAGYGLNGMTGEIVLSKVISLDSIDGDSLCALMNGLVEHAREWQKEYFLDASGITTDQFGGE